MGRLRPAVVTLREAAEYLGVADRCFNELHQAGVVRPCWEAVGKQMLFYYRAELDVLLDRLGTKAPGCTHVPAGVVTLADLRKTKFIPVWSLIVAVLEGTMMCSAVLDEGVGV